MIGVGVCGDATSYFSAFNAIESSLVIMMGSVFDRRLVTYVF